MLDELEIVPERAVIAGIMWILVLATIWVIPKSMGWQEFELGMKITMTVLSAPLIYVILSMMAD